MVEWRQGSVLSNSHPLHVAHSLDPHRHRLVVISHDCDLAGGRPKVEAILGQFIETPIGTYRSARNPRLLHLEFRKPGGTEQWMSLNHEDRVEVADRHAYDPSAVDVALALSPDNRRLLRRWLAARYGRPAFPRAFEDALKQAPLNGRNAYRSLDSIIQKVHEHLVGVFFDLGDDRDVDLQPPAVYGLRVTLVYDTAKDAVAARTASEITVGRIMRLFATSFGEAAAAQAIGLESCDAVPDSEFTVLDLRRNDHWRVEYMNMGEGSSESDLLDLDDSLI